MLAYLLEFVNISRIRHCLPRFLPYADEPIASTFVRGSASMARLPVRKRFPHGDRVSIVKRHAGRSSFMLLRLGCASGCVVECRICNREVAGSNLSLGYFAPRSTQPSIPPRSVNEYQLRLGRQRQVWLSPIADERVGVQVKL